MAALILELACMRGDKAVFIAFQNLKQIYPYLLLLVYAVFMCGYFIFQDYNDHYRFFSRVVFVIGVFAIVKGISQLWRQPLFQVVCVYLLYLVISGFWSEPMDWYRLGQKSVLAVYIASFIALTFYLVDWNKEYFERLLQICVLIASVAAIVNMVEFYQGHDFPKTRMIGQGSLTNINEFSNVYGVFSLLALTFAMRSKSKLAGILYFSSVAVFVSFAWFGQSRTVFVSMLIALVVLAGLSSVVKSSRVILALFVLAGILVFAFYDLAQLALLRGEGLRPLIWYEVWNEIKSAPILGHGIVSVPEVQAGGLPFETAHNAFLQVLWNGGILGLGLFLLLLVLLFRSAWQQGRRNGIFTVLSMLVFATGVMMTGVDSLLDRPRDQWMLFWLPVALLIANQITVSPVLAKTDKT